MTSEGITSGADVAVGAGRRSPLIEARDLVRSFGQTPALRGAGVSVTAGEILAVMGPSGSGKSTLLHCLAGILVPDSGQVWFDGRRIDAMGENERSALRRDRFGFVFQFGQLVPEADGRGERGATAAARRHPPRAGADGSPRLARAARPRRPGAAPVRGTVRRAGPAGRAGPRPGRRAAGSVRRRADRVAGLPHRRTGHEPAGRRRPRPGHHGHPGHPRGPRGRLRRPRGDRARRHGDLAVTRAGPSGDPARPAPDPERRPGGRLPARHHRRRPWRWGSACCWSRWPASTP